MIDDTLWVDLCLGVYPEMIIDQVKQKKFKKVVILGEFEWDIPVLTKEFVDELKSTGTELFIIHCGFPCEYYDIKYNNLGIKIENVIFWKTHWFNYSKLALKHIDTEDQNIINIYPFISLNNRSHIHRCALIDELAKRNLIEKGVVSWIAHLNENPNYPYKHFDRNKRIYLDDNFKTELDSFLIPKQFYESFLHIITEATTTVPIISEKVVKAILLKKPFLTLAGPNWNNTLRELGFKLYNEIFDYSYDTYLDLETRTSKLVDNIECVLNTNLGELYKILQPKIEFNFNRLNEIVSDENYIPFLIKKRLNFVKAKVIESIPVDSKYNQFIEMIK